MFYTKKAKERIFINRTKQNYPQIWEYYEELLRNEKLSEAELYVLNFKKRQEILIYAYEHSPFYKRFYDESGINPYKIKTEEDWNKVPVVTKDMVRQFSDEIKVLDEINEFGRANNTGGSTGKPLKIFNDKRDTVPSVYWRFRGWWWDRQLSRRMDVVMGGVNSGIIGQNEAIIYRPLPDTNNAVTNPKLFYPMLMCELNARTMNEDDIERFIKDIKKIKPVYLRGYAGAVYEFARICQKRGIKFHGIKGIEVTSTPTNKLMRKTMETVFNCKVFDTYASNESLLIAAECNHSTDNHYLHVFSDIKHIDIVDENNKILPCGEIGYTCITSFNNKVFPFVKYLLGDRTYYVKGKCECGLNFPRIAPVEGRESDYLMTKQGNKLFGLNSIFDDFPEEVVGYQFIQHKNLSVTLKIVPEKNVSNERIKDIFNFIEKTYSQINFYLEIVNAIPHDAGKIRFILHENE